MCHAASCCGRTVRRAVINHNEMPAGFQDARNFGKGDIRISECTRLRAFRRVPELMWTEKSGYEIHLHIANGFEIIERCLDVSHVDQPAIHAFLDRIAEEGFKLWWVLKVDFSLFAHDQ